MRPVSFWKRGSWKFLFSPFLLFFLFLSPSRQALGQVTQFAFQSSSSPASGVTYFLNGAHAVTFTVWAENSSGVTVNTYNGSVTALLVDTVTDQASDLQAVFVDSLGNTYTGQAPLTFTGGILTFGVTFAAGANSEAVSLESSTITAGDFYPSTGGFTVQGFGQNCYVEPFNPGNYPTTTQLYVPSPSPTPQTDLMEPNFNNLELGTTFSLALPQGGGTTGTSGIDYAAAAFVTLGVSGGYAFGGQGVTTNLWVNSINNLPTTVDYQLILDYNGSLTDYNNPVTSDTVYQGVFNPNSSGFGAPFVANPALVPGFSAFQPFMTNGKIILRIWTPPGAPPAGLRFLSNVYTASKFCFMNIPYSPANVLPLKVTSLTPSTIFDGATVPMTITMLNQFSSPVTEVQIQVPEVGGNFWTINSSSSSLGTVSSVVQATASSPGTITLDMASSALNNNASVALYLNVTAPSNTLSNWSFPIVNVITNSGTGAINDSSLAVVNTLGLPGVPAGFAAAPVSYTASGGAVSLTWTAVANTNSPLGYVITRNPAFSSPLTVGPSSAAATVDSTATNLTSYTYQIASYNAVTQSATASAGPATAFINPGSPLNPAALSSNNAVTVSWASPTATPGTYTLNGYQVWRYNASSTPTVIATVGASTFGYNDTTATNATQWYYQIAAVDNQYTPGVTPGGAHISALSPAAPVTGYPPGWPPVVSAPAFTTSPSANMQVSWAAPTGNLNAPVSYIVGRSVNGGAFAAAATLAASTLTYNDAAVSSGNYYVYQVAAYDGAVDSNFSAPVTGFAGPAPPGTPTPNPSGTAVTLTWSPPPPSSGETIVSYVIFRTGGTGPATLGPVSTPAVTFSDNTAVLGTDYFYQVAAVDNHSTPVTGGLSTGVNSALLPSQPTGVNLSLNPANDNVTVAWATPAPTETNLQVYSLTRAINTATPTVVAAPLSTAVSYLDTGITTANAGQTLTYSLSPQNNLGGVGPAAVKTVIVPPNAPTGLSSSSAPSVNSPTGAAITLTWGAVSGQGVTQYTVYRQALPSGTSTPIPIATVTSGTTYTDNSPLTQSVTYTYYVTAQNGGGSSQDSVTISTALGLLAPSSLSLSVSETGSQFDIAVSWTAPPSSSSLTSYNLARNTNPTTGGVTMLLTHSTSVTFQDAVSLTSAGTTFYYFAQGQNIAGGGALAVSGIQMPPNPPGTPTASSSSSAITLSWPAVTGENVNQYTVYRQALPAGTSTPIPIATVTSATYTDNSASLAQGVTYAYNVTASDPGGGPGVPGGASLPSPSLNWGLVDLAPTGLAVTIDHTGLSNTVTLTWAAVAPNALSVTLNANGAPLAGLAASVLSYVDSSQLPDTYASYTLSTTDPWGNSAPSAPPVTQLTYPAPVTLVSVTLNANGSRSVTWTPIVKPDVTSYNVYRQLLGASSFVSVGSFAASGLTLPVTLTNSVLPGKQYLYWVTAVNATGEGSSATTVTIGVPPDAPSSVTALSGLSTTAGVSLTWAEPNGGSESVTGYTVYRSPVGGPYGPVANGLTNLNYLDNSVVGANVYYYMVAADDANGQESVTSSANAVTVTAYGLPNAPTLTSETDGNGSASLVWSPAVVTSYPVASYNLYDSANGGATVKANATPIAGLSSQALGLTNGTPYSLWVQAVDNQGHLSAYSTPLAGEPVAPPSIPASFTGANGYSAVEITWLPSLGGTLPVSFYLVEKIGPLSAPATTYIQVAGNLTGYVDNVGSAPATFAYMVEAVDNTGVTIGSHVSGYTSPVTVWPGVSYVNPPSNVAALGTNSSVTLSWTDAFAGGAAVTAYHVYKATALAGPYSDVATIGPGIQVYADTAVTNGNTYYYYLIDENNIGGTSSASATVLGLPAPPPQAPAPVSVLDGNASETLNWTASPNEGAVTISKYAIVQDVLPGVPVTLASTSGPVTAYTDSSVSINNSGETVVYQVAAVNSNGTTGSLSAPVTGYPYAPFPAKNFSSNDSATAVTLSWLPPTTVTWPSISQYVLLRTPLAGGTPVPMTITSSPATDATVIPGQLYSYTLTATDAKGHVSAATGPVTDGAFNPPAAPATLIATAGSQQVLLDWPPSAAVTGSLPVSFYLLTINGGAAVTVPATQTSYLDSGLIDPSTVTVSLIAVDSTGLTTGNHVSSLVGPMVATTSSSDLNPPTGLAATALSPTSVKLNWQRPNDEGLNVVSYNLYRAVTFTTVLGSPLASITNPALNPVTTYTDATASANTTYYYVMTAVYQQGAVQTASPPSNHAAVTTTAPAVPASPVTTGQMGFNLNLFKPLTGQVLEIYFAAPNSGPVEIDVYNISGNPIRALYAAAVAGVQENTSWDGKDRHGNTVASGVYLLEIKAPGLHQVKKVLVVK